MFFLLLGVTIFVLLLPSNTAMEIDVAEANGGVRFLIGSS